MERGLDCFGPARKKLSCGVQGGAEPKTLSWKGGRRELDWSAAVREGVLRILLRCGVFQGVEAVLVFTLSASDKAALNECPKRAENGNEIDEDPDPGLVEVVPSLDLDNGAHEYAKQEEKEKGRGEPWGELTVFK